MWHSFSHLSLFFPPSTGHRRAAVPEEEPDFYKEYRETKVGAGTATAAATVPPPATAATGKAAASVLPPPAATAATAATPLFFHHRDFNSIPRSETAAAATISQAANSVDTAFGRESLRRESLPSYLTSPNRQLPPPDTNSRWLLAQQLLPNISNLVQVYRSGVALPQATTATALPPAAGGGAHTDPNSLDAALRQSLRSYLTSQNQQLRPPQDTVSNQLLAQELRRLAGSYVRTATSVHPVTLARTDPSIAYLAGYLDRSTLSGLAQIQAQEAVPAPSTTSTLSTRIANLLGQSMNFGHGGGGGQLP